MKKNRGSIVKSTINTYTPRLIAVALALLVWIAPTHSQTLSPTEKPVVLETKDGLILVGTIEKSKEGVAVLKSAYGTLNVPLDKILRVDGDRFDPALGIVRENNVTLRSDGSVILEYLQTVSAKHANRTVNVLAQGNTLNVFDMNGEPLAYMSKSLGDFTRCTIDMPEYRLPAVRLQVLQPAAATVSGDRLYYAYRYTPRVEGTLQLTVTLPHGSALVQSTPEPDARNGDDVVWRQTLRRQQDAEFAIVVELK